MGTCTPQVTKTPGSAEGWTSAARVCSAIADVPGGCVAAGQQCVLEGPSAFGAAICVHQSGDVSCPGGYPTKSVIYGGETDMRGCGPCTCSSKTTGGSCAGTISVWGDLAGSCTGAAPGTYTLGTTCGTYNGAGNNPGYAQGNFHRDPGHLHGRDATDSDRLGHWNGTRHRVLYELILCSTRHLPRMAARTRRLSRKPRTASLLLAAAHVCIRSTADGHRPAAGKIPTGG